MRNYLFVVMVLAGVAACVEAPPIDDVAQEAIAPPPPPPLPPWPLPPFVPPPLCANGNAVGGMQNTAGMTCEIDPRGTNLCCDTRPNLRYPNGLTCAVGFNRPPPWGECVVAMRPPPPPPPPPVATPTPTPTETPTPIETPTPGETPTIDPAPEPTAQRSLDDVAAE